MESASRVENCLLKSSRYCAIGCGGPPPRGRSCEGAATSTPQTSTGSEASTTKLPEVSERERERESASATARSC